MPSYLHLHEVLSGPQEEVWGLAKGSIAGNSDETLLRFSQELLSLSRNRDIYRRITCPWFLTKRRPG